MPVAVSNRRGNADRLARVREISRHRLGDIPDRADLHDRRLRLLQHQLFVNGPDLGLFLVSFLAASAVFFRRGHRNVVLKVAHARSVFGVNLQGMLKALQVDALALGVDLVLSVVLIPLGHGRVLMHVLDDLPPTHAGVVRAEADLALLRRIRNDAHFGAAAIVVEQILEPHPGDEQEVPRIGLPALHGVFVRAVRRRLAVFLLRALRKRPGLIKFLEEVVQLQPLGALEGLVVLQEGHGHHEVRKSLAARSVGDVRDIFRKLYGIEEARNGRPFLRFFVDHQRRAHSAIRVAAAGERTPLRLLPLHHIREPGKRADERNGKPVARRLDFAHLRADVLRQVRKRVALAQPAFRSNVFVAPGKRNRLEAHKRDFLGVLHRKLHHRAHLIVVHVIDDRHHQHDLDARLVHILDGTQLHIEQIADLPMAVGVVADPVKLQIRVAHARFERLLAELLALRELDAVSRGLHAVVTDLPRVGDRIEEIRAHRRLAAAELHGHLAARLDLQRVIQDFLNLFPTELMHVTDLVRVHEAGIAHHVAAIRKVNGKHRPAAIPHRRGAMLVKVFVVVRGNVAARVLPFDPAQPLGIDSHHVFVVAVERAILHHPHLAVALDNLRLDLADLLAHQLAPIFFAGDDRFARFFHARGTKRIGLPRKAQRRLGLFPGFQQRLVRPLRSDRRIGILLVEVLDGVKSDSSRLANNPIKRPCDLRAYCIRHKPLSSTFKNAFHFTLS